MIPATTHYKEARLDDLLFAFRRKIRDAMRKVGYDNELTFSQVEILYFIGDDGEKSMKSISDHLKIKPPSATAMVAEMEKKGIVRRKGSAIDRRVVCIAFTEKAKKMFTSICKRKAVIHEKMLSKLSAKDRKTLERIIRIIVTE